eukprot:2447982-Amphidinium_carterae.1
MATMLNWKLHHSNGLVDQARVRHFVRDALHDRSLQRLHGARQSSQTLAIGLRPGLRTQGLRA